MRHLIFYLVPMLFAFPLFSHGREIALSPERQSNQHWRMAIQEQARLNNLSSRDLQELQNSLSRDRFLDANQLPIWTYGIDALHSLNQEAHQKRWYDNPNSGNFMRRAPWFYPHNGCYAKAAHVSAIAKEHGYPQPGKVYVYGNLRFNTQYARKGRALWSYHVVAGYSVDGIVYVLDPMVNNGEALQLEKWASSISPKPSGLRFKFCDSNSYSPLSRCRGGSGNGAYLGHIRGLLKDEWSHLVRLKYSPQELLAPAF